MSVNEKVAKVADNLCCEYCDYSTSKQSNFDKHLLTPKHQKMAFGENGDSLGDAKSSKLNIIVQSPIYIVEKDEIFAFQNNSNIEYVNLLMSISKGIEENYNIF